MQNKYLTHAQINVLKYVRGQILKIDFLFPGPAALSYKNSSVPSCLLLLALKFKGKGGKTDL